MSLNSHGKTELARTYPKREPSVVLAQRAQRQEGFIPSVENQRLSPTLLAAYLVLFNIVHEQGLTLTKSQKLAMVPDAVKALLHLDTNTIALVSKLITESSLIPDKIDLTKPTAINDLLTLIEQSLIDLLSDPTTDPNLLEIMQFFLFQLNGGEIFGTNFVLDPRLGSPKNKILYPDRRLDFTIHPYSYSQPIPSMGGSVQAVIMNNIKPINHRVAHQINSDVMAELFFQDLHQEHSRRIGQIRVTMFRDPLLFIPDIVGKNPRETQEKYIAFKKELDILWGLFAETLYDFIAPINLSPDIGRISDITLDFRTIIAALASMHPTSGFRIMRDNIGATGVARAFSNFDSGVIIEFADKKMGFNQKPSDYHNTRKVTQSTPAGFLEKVEAMLVKRFNNNFELLRAQVSKVAELAYQESLATLKQTHSMDTEAKTRLRFEITRVYATWLAMALGQYNRVILQPALAYKLNQTEDLIQMLAKR